VPAHVAAGRAQHALGVAIEPGSSLDGVGGCIDDFAVHVELALRFGSVANSNRPRVPVSGEMTQDALVRGPVAIHVIEHAQRRLRQAGRVQQPVDERPRPFCASKPEQGPIGTMNDLSASAPRRLTD
jgi:hypothetical protein